MRSFFRGAAAAVAVLALALAPAAHVRLKTSGGTPLFWSTPSNIPIVINSTGSDDISDGSHETAIRLAIRAWNDVSGTSATLVEDTAPAQQARTDYNSDTIHLVLFDESNVSGYFTNPGTVAVTPVWFFGSGLISDADVIFNGLNHAFTTEVPGPSGAFDVGDVATHELGHLLGLDHSGAVGATMYPYVDPTVVLHRSPSLDDVGGLRAAYPSGTHGQLTGTVQRSSDSSPVQGAHVVARDALGATAGATLTAANGTFAIQGLDAGIYDVAVSPLTGAVSSGNIGSGNGTIQTDFESAETGGSFVLGAGGSVAVGTISVDAAVGVRLGSAGDPFPLRCVKGLTNVFFNSVSGTGLTAGSTLTTPDASLTIHTVVWGGSKVDFSVDVGSGAVPGHADLKVETAGGDVHILPGAFEITEPDPTVAGASPTTGADMGGTAITITGTNFTAGSRVVIGPNIYVDGDLGGCTVVDANTITLTTASMPVGTYDIVVIDQSGVEGRRVNGFSAIRDPMFDLVFPLAGSAAGGTELTLIGSDFLDGAGFRVEIDGVVQTMATVVDSSTITVVTNGGAVGGPYNIDVYNHGGGVATQSFSYVAPADPVIGSVTPAAGTVNGGSTVQILGSGFGPGLAVYFGNAEADDPASPAEWSPSPTVTFVDANTLDVVTPARFSAGQSNVIVFNPSTMQGDVALSAFLFQSPSGGGGGGGGGCSVGAPPMPDDPWTPASGAAWFLLPIVLVWLNAQRLRRRALRRVRA